MTDSDDFPIIAITMGDPAGIGPEIIRKALQNEEVFRQCVPIVYGDSGILAGIPAEVRQATRAPLCALRMGTVSREAGQAAGDSVLAAAAAVLDGEAEAMVTAPLNKEAMTLAGFPFPGHTELLAEATGTTNYAMLLVSDTLRVIHVSTHVSLREAIERVQTARVFGTIHLGIKACRDLGIAAPRVGVAGLNPHAGENGMFGDEDAEEIAPAVALVQDAGFDVSGPHPPDTLFARAIKGEFDLVVAMYHDQGHIPVKLHGFDTGVNITAGLPIIRVSVDHGTAFDIAGQGIASEKSLLEAIRLAAQMAIAKRNRREE